MMFRWCPTCIESVSDRFLLLQARAAWTMRASPSATLFTRSADIARVRTTDCHGRWTFTCSTQKRCDGISWLRRRKSIRMFRFNDTVSQTATRLDMGSYLLVALSPRRININFCVIRADRKADEKLSVSFRFSLPFTFSPNRSAINFRTYGLCIRKQSVHFRRPQRRDGESRVMQFCSASH